MTRISRRNIFLYLMAVSSFATAYAHEPFMDCYLKNEQKVTCEAGYEDGSLAKNEDRIFIKDENGSTLLSGKFTEGMFSFQKPKVEYIVVFVGNEIGHIKRVYGASIQRN